MLRSLHIFASPTTFRSFTSTAWGEPATSVLTIAYEALLVGPVVAARSGSSARRSISHIRDAAPVSPGSVRREGAMRRVVRGVRRGTASMALAGLAALLAFSVLLPPTASVVMAAPAALAVSFRDLPASARAGSALSIQVGVSSGATCDGTITYRDGVIQKLDSIGESD